MEPAAASTSAMAAGSAGGSVGVAAAAASAPPLRVLFGFPTNARQTQYDAIINIKWDELQGTTKEV